MPFRSIVNPEHLILLTTALDRYCMECDIVDEHERQYAGGLLMALFNSGVTDPNKLVAGLYAALECSPPEAV
jgi:hypothetical protein